VRSAELVGVAQPIACCGKVGRIGGRGLIAREHEAGAKTADLARKHALFLASVSNPLIWICSPWGSVIRTYQPCSAFSWTGSNFVLGLEPTMLAV